MAQGCALAEETKFTLGVGPMNINSDMQRVLSVIDLDENSAHWVCEIANLLHTTPSVLIASIIRDVVRDDVEAHIIDHQAERTLLQ